MSPFLDPDTRRSHRRRNAAQSAILLAGIGAVLAIATYLVWGLVGPVLTLVALATLYTLAPNVPPETMMRLYRARLVAAGNNSQLSSLVDVLAFRAELPNRPQLYIVPSMTLNAFAAGTPDRAAIAITEGLMRRLSLREIAGVLAHEMSHIRNNDLHIMGFADLVTRVLQLLSYVALALTLINVLLALQNDQLVSWWTVLLLYLAPALSSLLQLALSRAREFDADLEAVGLTGDPLGLAAALRRLDTYTGHIWEDLMFPVPARRVPQPSLLRTHPTTEERVSRLLSLGTRSKLDPIVIVEQPMVSLVGFGPIEMRPRYRWPGLWF
ncbi:MAG: zinc metalloprotease HtpX [Hyphomicrobium sp.]